MSIRIFGQVQQVKAFVGFSWNMFSTFLKHSDSHFCPLFLFTLIYFLQIHFDSNKIKNETWLLWHFPQFEWSVHFLLKTKKKLIVANVFIYVEMGDIKAEDGEDAEDDWYWFQTIFMPKKKLMLRIMLMLRIILMLNMMKMMMIATMAVQVQGCQGKSDTRQFQCDALSLTYISSVWNFSFLVPVSFHHFPTYLLLLIFQVWFFACLCKVSYIWL